MAMQTNLSTYSFAMLMAVLAVCYIAVESLGPMVASSLGLSSWMGYNLFSASWEASLAVGAFVYVLTQTGQPKPKKAQKQIDDFGFKAKIVKEQDADVKRRQKESSPAAAKSKPTSVARKVVSSEPSKQYEKAQLSDALGALIKKGDVHRASKALLQLEADYGNVCLSQYTCVITMCSKAGDADAARWWLQKVKEAGYVPNAVCFNSVINVFAKQGDLKQALEIVEDMRNAGVEYDTVTYNTLIDAWARADDAVSAQLWMQRLLASGVMPSVVSFASVMRVCAKAGLTEELEHWSQQAAKFGIELNTICFSAIINGFVKNDDVETAIVWLTRMIERGLVPNAPCFTGVLHGFINKGDMDNTGKVIDMLQAEKVELDAPVFSTAVCAAANSGFHKQAQDWAAGVVAAGYQLTRSAESSLMAANLLVPSPRSGKASEAPVAEQPAGQGISKSAARRALTGKRFNGIIKEFIGSKFGYIECEEVYAVYQRDVFLCNQQNPLQLGKGQKVSFTLQLDRHRGLPRASDVRAYQSEN